MIAQDAHERLEASPKAFPVLADYVLLSFIFFFMFSLTVVSRFR